MIELSRTTRRLGHLRKVGPPPDIIDLFMKAFLAAGLSADGGWWLLRNGNSNGGVNLDFWFGSTGDGPLVGDWNNDGVATVGVARDE